MLETTPDTATPRVAIVILTWNGKDLTLECLESLEAIATPNVERIVVDNASEDGTAEAVRERYRDGVTVIRNDANLGYSRGNNRGIEHALAGGADYILLLNNDTAVAPDFLDEMLADLRDNPGAGLAGPKTYYYTPPDQIWFAGGEVLLARGVARHIGIRERDRGQYDVPRDVDYASGCALLAGREVFDAVGMLDPSYQAYFEDTDFCMRATAAGFRVRYVPTAKVWHKISASTGGQLSRRKIGRKFRSTWKFLRRHAKPHHWLTIPFFFVADGIRILLLVATGRIRDNLTTRTQEHIE